MDRSVVAFVLMFSGEYAVQYFTEYGPSFDLDLTPSHVRNLNTEAYTESIVSTILSIQTVLLIIRDSLLFKKTFET